MPNVLRCEAGHYYDGDLYPECPHCKGSGFGGPLTSQEKILVSNLANRYLKEILPEAEIVDEPLSAGHVQAPTEEPEQREEPTAPAPAGQDRPFVAGWLVCREGPCRGKSYGVYYGFNMIGREVSNDISIPGDPSIAAKEHCAVVFDGRKCRFYIVARNGNHLMVNGQSLLQEGERVARAPMLKTGDEIRLGETVLVFIPYCDENRKWTSEEMMLGRNLEQKESR